MTRIRTIVGWWVDSDGYRVVAYKRPSKFTRWFLHSVFGSTWHDATIPDDAVIQ
jgi:hypothetical protein